MKPDDISKPVIILSDEQKSSFNEYLKIAVYRQLHKNQFLTSEQLRALLSLHSKEVNLP